MESRLRRRSLKQSKRQLYASLIAIVIVLFAAINFGPYLIGSLGGLIDAISGKSNQSQIINSNADIQAPSLDPLPDATPSARINVGGRADYSKGKIELYVNNSKEDEVDLINSQDFNFANVPLKDGANSIKAKIVIGDKMSDFSDEEIITFAKNAPKLDVSFPQDGQRFSKGDQEINVQGQTDPNNTVSVNGYIAIVNNSGDFSYTYKLSSGDNKLIITSQSPAGTTTTKELSVSYSE